MMRAATRTSSRAPSGVRRRAVADAQQSSLEDEERQQAGCVWVAGQADTADASPPSQGPNRTATGNVTARPGHARTRLSKSRN